MPSVNDPVPISAPPQEGLPRVPLPEGTRLDHYVIHSVLGSGGFGITYLAKHTLLGRLYAIKEYFPNEFSYREGQSVRSRPQNESTYRWGLDRFLSEARALARFKHPSIVDVISVFEANHTAYMVLNYEQARDWGAWSNELGRSPTQPELDKILLALLGALEAMHERELLHRDIAPDNVLIRPDGTPVLIDFGSAREAVRGHSRVMSAIVKRGYSPPEQYTSRPELQGPWSDIYALSATLYKILTGKMPLDATDRMLEDRLVPVSTLVQGDFRPTFLRAIDKGLSIRAKDRPQTVAEWRDDLFEGFVAEIRPSSKPLSRPVNAATVASISASSSPLASSASQPQSQKAPVDMSWLDEPVPIDDEVKPTSSMENPAVRKTVYGGLGLVFGAIAGALSSIILVSAVAVNCTGDSCYMNYLPMCTAIGALVGLGIGLVFKPHESAMDYQDSSKDRF